MEQLMAYNQEGSIKDYCDSFRILFDEVRNLEEISEFYAIYLFICGLEPKIRKIFVRWHQYSCTEVEDMMSLALKIDSNGLQDSFSPFDPNSSFYNKDLEFDINITLKELMKDNEWFRVGMIQETCDNIVHETIVDEVIDNVVLEKNGYDNKTAFKVFDEMPLRSDMTFDMGFDSKENNQQEMVGVVSQDRGIELVLEIPKEVSRETKEILVDDSRKGDLKELVNVKVPLNLDVMFEEMSNKVENEIHKSIGSGVRKLENVIEESINESVVPSKTGQKNVVQVSSSKKIEGKTITLATNVSFPDEIFEEAFKVEFANSNEFRREANNQLALNIGPVSMVIFYDVYREAGCEFKKLNQMEIREKSPYVALFDVPDIKILIMKERMYMWHKWKVKLWWSKVSSKRFLPSSACYYSHGYYLHTMYAIKTYNHVWVFDPLRPGFDPLIDIDPRLLVALFDLSSDADVAALVLRFGGECRLVLLNNKNVLAVFDNPAGARHNLAGLGGTNANCRNINIVIYEVQRAIEWKQRARKFVGFEVCVLLHHGDKSNGFRAATFKKTNFDAKSTNMLIIRLSRSQCLCELRNFACWKEWVMMGARHYQSSNEYKMSNVMALSQFSGVPAILGATRLHQAIGLQVLMAAHIAKIYKDWLTKVLTELGMLTKVQVFKNCKPLWCFICSSVMCFSQIQCSQFGFDTFD